MLMKCLFVSVVLVMKFWRFKKKKVRKEESCRIVICLVKKKGEVEWMKEMSVMWVKSGR